MVIDATPDTILANDRPVDVVQIWCDPKRPHAHRDPALRVYLANVARRTGMICIVRWSSTTGVVLVPPSLNDSGEWLEMGGVMSSEAVMREKLDAAGVQHAMRRPDLEFHVTP